MKFGVDTYSWTKLFLLFQTTWQDLISEIISNANFFITPEVRKELNHFHSGFKNIWDSIPVLKSSKHTNIDYNRNIFDAADISLFNLLAFDDFVIITEDRPMLATNITAKNNVISLADFFALLYTQNTLSKREFYHITKWFQDKKNISKKKAKTLLSMSYTSSNS